MPIKKKTPINESNLSNKPPCPGMIEPESLIDDALFMIEAITSPRKANNIIILMYNKYFNE
tara:strand:- start:25 stop:207 length:183 start_codon:yes stop_codon:yes gene_type:complete